MATKSKQLEIAKEALQIIGDPMAYFKKEAEETGIVLNVHLARLRSTDHEFLQTIAVKALLQMDD